MGEFPSPGKKKKAPEPLLRVWKTKSVFWDLPYWKILDTPYSLHQIHITKNVLESLLATLLNMPEKTKDGPKARTDLKILGIREVFHEAPPEETETEMDMDMDMGKKARRRKNIIAPLSLHLKSEGDRSIFQVPCWTQS